MHYATAENLGKSYGITALFEAITFHINKGDKTALVAKNGTGKSTLLKILSGTETPDTGKLWIHKDVKVVMLEQDPHFAEEKTVLENIFFHDHPVIRCIREYEAACTENNVDQLNDLVNRMDLLHAWDFDAKVKQVLGRLNIHQLQQPVKFLSGGQRKRAALARALIDVGFENKEVLLILDEPTNHLDVEMTEWLEQYLDKENVTLLLVTHDRYFLDNVCSEIWEFDQGRLFSYKGDYENYLGKKAARQEQEAAGLDKAKNLYRRELEWMRKQPRARTTKSKSRQDRFYETEKKALQNIRDEQLELHMKMNRLGGKILELKKIYKSFGDKIILKGFDYTFRKGEKAGIIGKNGTGKSTFLNLLQGIEKADSGKINVGDTVQFGYYAQQGLVMKQDMRVIEYVKSMAEHFPLQSGGSLSASAFLQLFLFDPDKQYNYISKLSGGEKRRLHLLSILFRNPNFLILDEPTNDLDLPTLVVLENFLQEFSGCILLVSHDRYFMDKLVDHLFVFEGNGVVRDFPGNYSQYRHEILTQDQTDRAAPDKIKPAGEELIKKKSQLSYKEKREFEQLEKEIHGLTREKEEVTEKLNSGTLSFDDLQQFSVRINEITALLDAKEMRWLELSELPEIKK